MIDTAKEDICTTHLGHFFLLSVAEDGGSIVKIAACNAGRNQPNIRQGRWIVQIAVFASLMIGDKMWGLAVDVTDEDTPALSANKTGGRRGYL